jgi:hypothetical protein
VFPARDYATVILFGLAVAVLRLRPLRILTALALAVARPGALVRPAVIGGDPGAGPPPHDGWC